MEEGFSCQMGRAENKIWFCGLDFKCHEVNIIPGREKADLKKLAWCLLPKKFGDLTFEKLKSFLKRGFYSLYKRGIDNYNQNWLGKQGRRGRQFI